MVGLQPQILDELNNEQRRAVEAGDGVALIVAGPGTGKTKTLTARMAWLLESGQAKPEDIVALTFTNKAAREMRERLGGLLGEGSKLPKIATFHALGRDLLRASEIGTLISERERNEIIRGLSKPAALRGANVREMSLLISRTKTSITPSDDEPIWELLRAYETALTDAGMHDFDDLLCKALEILRDDEAPRPGYKYVLVDEFQDTSEMQYEILKLLGSGGNIFAIGDPNQSIYAFRGAGAEMFVRLRQDFPQVQEIDLIINYRSRPEIIALANAIFPDSPQLLPDKKSVPQNYAGAHFRGKSVQALQTLNEYSEAAYMLGRIEQGIGGSTMLSANGDQEVREPRDYAVLYRTHRAAKVLQRAFADSGVPYQVVGEGSPYEQPEVQGIIEIMRCLHAPSDQAKLRLMKLPALKSPTLSQIDALLVKFQSADDLLVVDLARDIAEKLEFGQDSQRQNIQQFLGSLVQFGSCQQGLAACLRHIDEISEGEFFDPSVNAVTLLTIHAAKGLEFPHMFLIAAEEGILPKTAQGRTLRNNDTAPVDEEHRLFYVAVTRAKDNLEILHTKFRGGEPAKLSRFASELPETMLPRSTDPDMKTLERRAEKRRQKRAQTSLL